MKLIKKINLPLNNLQYFLFRYSVLGTHSNMCSLTSAKIFLKTIFYNFFPSLLLPEEDHHLMFPLSTHLKERLIETGYFHIQATKPDSVGTTDVT